MKVLPLTVAVPVVEDAAAAVAGGVAGEGAAAHRQRPEVGDAAAAVPAELPVKVLPLTVTVPLLTMPPPSSPSAELLVKVLPITVAVPTLARPPPPRRRSCW